MYWAVISFWFTWMPALMADMTASLKRTRSAAESHSSSIAWSWAPVLPAASAASMRSLRGGRLAFVVPRMQAWSRGSMVEVIRVAASASVRAMARRSVPGLATLSVQTSLFQLLLLKEV